MKTDIAPLEFIFKAKVDDKGNFKRPELTMSHVIGLFNSMQLRIAIRKRKNMGAVFPGRCLNLASLPSNVLLVNKGFISTFKIVL
jgi:hypothetical protein